MRTTFSAGEAMFCAIVFGKLLRDAVISTISDRIRLQAGSICNSSEEHEFPRRARSKKVFPRRSLWLTVISVMRQ